jgi:hypothetical protein
MFLERGRRGRSLFPFLLGCLWIFLTLALWQRSNCISLHMWTMYSFSLINANMHYTVVTKDLALDNSISFQENF